MSSPNLKESEEKFTHNPDFIAKVTKLSHNYLAAKLELGVGTKAATWRPLAKEFEL